MLTVCAVGYISDVLNFDTQNFKTLQINTVECRYNRNILNGMEVSKYIFKQFIFVTLFTSNGSRLKACQ
jgi:hypothetical protein